jgi:adenylate kinase
MSDIIIFGPPGSGKGTQAKLITTHRHVSTGDLFRRAVAEDTLIGRIVAPMFATGRLFPDELTLRLVEEEIARGDDIVWDGFPRTLRQAQALDEMLGKHGRSIGKVIHLDVSESVLLDRVLARFEVEQREDDNAETFRERLKAYYKQTMPVLDHYGLRTIGVDGSKAVEAIAARIAEIAAGEASKRHG